MSNMSVGEENKDGVCRHGYPHFLYKIVHLITISLNKITFWVVLLSTE